MRRMVAAVVSWMTRRGCGFLGFHKLRSVAQRADHVRPDDQPAIGDGRHRIHHLQRRHADFLSHGNRAHRNRRPILQAAKHSPAFPRQVDAGGLAETKRANVVVKFGSAQAQAYLNGADVARIGQDLRNAEIAVCFMIANAMPGNVNRALLTIDQYQSGLVTP